MKNTNIADVIKTLNALLAENQACIEHILDSGGNLESHNPQIQENARQLLQQLTQVPVLEQTPWNPYPEVKPPASGHYLVWVDAKDTGWTNQACIEFFNDSYQEFEGEAGVLEDGGIITHWMQVTPPN